LYLCGSWKKPFDFRVTNITRKLDRFNVLRAESRPRATLPHVFNDYACTKDRGHGDGRAKYLAAAFAIRAVHLEKSHKK
jgi:hypothetical protein